MFIDSSNQRYEGRYMWPHSWLHGWSWVLKDHEDSSFCLPSRSRHSHACSPCVVAKMTQRIYSICLEIPTEKEYIFLITHRKRTKITSHLFTGFGPFLRQSLWRCLNLSHTTTPSPEEWTQTYPNMKWKKSSMYFQRKIGGGVNPLKLKTTGQIPPSCNPFCK